ncbi:MAG TPA: hypothetical protein DCE36_12995, partial [Pseudomonas sp.]|nr:hypothetical protein [Pseudomonas sp.]
MIEDGEAQSQDQRLDRTADKLAPGAFTGALSTIGPNLLRGAIEGGRTVQSTALQLGSLAIESDLAIGSLYAPDDGQIADQQKFRETQARDIGESTAKSVMGLRPDPSEVGMVGQILGEASAILPRTIAGAVAAGPLGAVVAAGAPAGFSSKQVGMAEGLDESTATKKGLIDAATVGIGVALPAAKFVKPLLGDLAIAVGANVGLGMAGRGATAKLLESNGYDSQAAQYKVMDGTALATDAIMGLAFFGLGRASFKRPTTKQVDAALTERTNQHADIDTAPGAPIDPRSAVAHQDAIRTVINQLQRGEPVVLPDSIHSAQFLREDTGGPIGPARSEIMEAARLEAVPAIRKQLRKEIASDLPNTKEVATELAQIQKQLDGLSETKAPRDFETLPSEIKGRSEAVQQIRELTKRKAQLDALMVRADAAIAARSDLEAIGRGEVPERFAAQVDAQAEKVGRRFKPSPVADGVRNAKQQPMAQIARQEITRILDDIERSDPTLQPKALDIPEPKAPPKADAS